MSDVNDIITLVLDDEKLKNSSSFSGKESTSVGLSMPLCSRLIAWMPASLVNITLIRQSSRMPWARSAAFAARRTSPAASG